VRSPPELESREGAWERDPVNHASGVLGQLRTKTVNASPGEQKQGALSKPSSHTF